MNRKIRERPRRRTLKNGSVVWRAQVNKEGKRTSLGTYPKRADAQARIDEWYDQGAYVHPSTFGAYASTWTTRHPRSVRTNRTNDSRVNRVLGVRISGRELRDWPLNELRRKHALELVAHLLTEQERAVTGAQNILRTLSALAEDAITDELCDHNPFQKVRIRSNDPRAVKPSKVARVFPLEDLHRLADAAGQYRPMVRVLTDCGLRLGEMLGLERQDFDGSHLHVRGNAWNGVFTLGDQPTKRHVRSVPVPASTAELLSAVPRRLDTPLLFPTLTGKIWHESNFRCRVWKPAQDLSGVRATPHECRHSYVSALNAEGIDAADVAAVAGHGVQTMNARYRHSLGRSDDFIRAVIG
jgi:integrase